LLGSKSKLNEVPCGKPQGIGRRPDIEARLASIAPLPVSYLG